jgi:hypothetical protein
MGAVLEDEACHEDISIGIGRRINHSLRRAIEAAVDAVMQGAAQQAH